MDKEDVNTFGNSVATIVNGSTDVHADNSQLTTPNNNDGDVGIGSTSTSFDPRHNSNSVASLHVIRNSESRTSTIPSVPAETHSDDHNHKHASHSSTQQPESNGDDLPLLGTPKSSTSSSSVVRKNNTESKPTIIKGRKSITSRY